MPRQAVSQGKAAENKKKLNFVESCFLQHINQMIGERICRINVIYQVTIYANPALLGGRSLGGIPGWRLPNNLRAGRNRDGGKLKTVNYLRSKVKQQSELAFKTNNLFPSWDLQHPLDWRKHTVDHRRNLTLSANIWITNSSWHNPLGDPWSRLQTFSVSRWVEVSGPETKRQKVTWSWQVSKKCWSLLSSIKYFW